MHLTIVLRHTGGLIRVAVVLAEGSVPRRLALGAPGRAEMQWLYSTFLFQHLAHDNDEVNSPLYMQNAR